MLYCWSLWHLFGVYALNFLQTPLFLAVVRQNLQAISYLLSANANPLLPDSNGSTPLHCACINGYAECANALLNRTIPITHGSHIPEINLTNNLG
jgi:ankyrin repeat protein